MTRAGAQKQPARNVDMLFCAPQAQLMQLRNGRFKLIRSRGHARGPDARACALPAPLRQPRGKVRQLRIREFACAVSQLLLLCGEFGEIGSLEEEQLTILR